MYEAHFGLKRPPFRITPDTSLFYDGGKRGDILEALVYAVQRGEGIVKVVGEVGSGKTMLCRMLQLKLPKAVEIIYIANPSVSAQDILFVIAHELGLSVDKKASKHEVMHMLQDYLLQRHMEDKQVVLFVEEAQSMPLETLEEIRLLSNLETDQHKLLQTILFGQPELDENLAQQSIRQLRERITHNFNLPPLTRDEIQRYLNFRMREVGYTGPELIDDSLAKKIEQYSGGLLRRINIIADKILLSAFAESTHNLTLKHVVAAVNDSNFGHAVKRLGSKVWWALLLVVIVSMMGTYTTQYLWKPFILGTSMITDDEMGKIETVLTENLSQSVDDQSEHKAPVSTGDIGEQQQEDRLAITTEQTLQASAQPEPEAVITEKPTALLEEVQQSSAAENLSTSNVVEMKQEIPYLQAIPDLTEDDSRWLKKRLQQSRAWLDKANMDAVSIQVMMRKASAAEQLVNYLKNDWPLDLQQTYLYQLRTDTQSIFRVFYGEFDSVATGKLALKSLPASVKVNSPYLQSVYRMRKVFL
ncbi:MAG: AAA family ATPase [Gammaproteobacteria bacterium]|nr:AAA family ATPase [Gammaproteobacteria bacterium]